MIFYYIIIIKANKILNISFSGQKIQQVKIKEKPGNRDNINILVFLPASFFILLI